MILNPKINEYENNIIPPPLEFRDKPIPALEKPVPVPRTKKPVPAPRIKKIALEKPVPAPRTKIEQTNKALKGFTNSYEINIKNNKDPLVQLQSTRTAVAYHIMNLLNSMKGLKFVETLKVTFNKDIAGETVYKTAYFNTPAKTMINNQEIFDLLILTILML